MGAEHQTDHLPRVEAVVATGFVDAAVEIEGQPGGLRVDGELLALVLEHHLLADARAQLAVDGLLGRSR
jgi:hypothetical protein